MTATAGIALSSCSTFCCNKERARIEADVAMATEKKEDVEALQKEAYLRIAWADRVLLKQDFPALYERSFLSWKSGGMAYDDLKYPTAKKLYLEVIAFLSDEVQARVLAYRQAKVDSDAMMEQALVCCPDQNAPERFKAAKDLYVKAEALKTAEDLPNAIETQKKAAAALEYAGEYACVTLLRNAALNCAALKGEVASLPKLEKSFSEDKFLWERGTPADYKAGTLILRELKEYYIQFLARNGCNELKTGIAVQVIPDALVIENPEKDRLAREQLERDKAAADAAIAKALSCLEWAEQNGIEAEYSEVYAAAREALSEAQALYENVAYAEVPAQAAKVCETIFTEFWMKKPPARAAEPLQAEIKVSLDRFTPDGDGHDDIVEFDMHAWGGAAPKQWQLEIFEEITNPHAEEGAWTTKRQSFAQWTGDGAPPARISWDGMSNKRQPVSSGVHYPFVLTVADENGATAKAEGVVTAGILLQADGASLRINIPSFAFSADKGDFSGLSPDIIEANTTLIKDLAMIFNRLHEYSIRIEGHANNVSKISGRPKARIEAEEKQEVGPLALVRAQTLRDMLIKNGVDKDRITVVSLGSSSPITSFEDSANRWKNRRVEFVLSKESKQ